MFRKRLPEITYYQKLELKYETFYTKFNIHDFKKFKKKSSNINYNKLCILKKGK